MPETCKARVHTGTALDEHEYFLQPLEDCKASCRLPLGYEGAHETHPLCSMGVNCQTGEILFRNAPEHGWRWSDDGD